jgi:oligopeptidase B
MGPFAYMSRYRKGGHHSLVGRVAGDAMGARARPCSTAMRRPKARPISSSAGRGIRPDRRGSECYTARMRSWQTGEDLSDVVEQTSGSVVRGLEP